MSVSLEEITLKIASGSTPTGGKDSYKSEGITLIRSMNVYNFKFLYKDLAFIDDKQAKKLSNVIIEKNDILLNITGASVGRCTMVPEHLLPARVNQHVMVIRPNQKKAHPNYLLYLINSDYYKASLMLLSETGATREALTKDDISKFKINLPPLKTQKKIAGILSNYDSLIEKNLKQIKLLEEYAKITYEEWFVRLKFPEHKKCKIVDGVPEGWEYVKLIDSCNLIMGQSPKSEFINEENNGLPFHQGVSNYGQRFPINKIWSSGGNRFAEAGDILFSVRAPVGRLNIAIEKIILGRGLSSINHKLGLNSFLFYQLQNIFFKDNIIGSGAIFESVTKKEIENIKLVYNLNVARNFNDMIEPIDREIKNLIQQNQNLKKTRDLLLPRLISGKLDVKEL